MATTKKTSIKKTASKKVVNDKLSSSGQEDSLLKKNGIDEMSLDDLIEFAKKTKVEIPEVTGESERVNIVLPVLAHFAQKEDLLLGFGVLDILNDGYGFLRNPDTEDNNDDIYVSQSQVRRFSLRQGDKVAGQVRQPKDKERYYGLTKVEMVNGYDPESSQMKQRPVFEKLTPIYPNERLTLETGNKPFSTRLIDIFSPIGKGQRALIVAPPKAGKTILLKDIANSIEKNSPDIKLIVALIGERPEEVTDMRRSVNGEVFSSTFDEPVEDHCKTSETALERARRLVESGQNVVLLLDSLTRLGRAYNIAVPSSGKTLSGGMDPYALYPPKKFFGAARNCEEGGSLTIIATALVDTGSRLDDLIYEEFKGTGNMELHLDRGLAERRIWPAINIEKSGTRHEELLQNETTLSKITQIRRIMAAFPSENNEKTWTEKIVDGLRSAKSNQDFLDNMQTYLQDKKD